MTTLSDLLETLWKDYSTMNGQAGAIHEALEQRGEKIFNDHVAFRTFNHPKTDIDVLSSFFTKLGYADASGAGYHFTEKKLFARHFEHPDPRYPKIFISELRLELCGSVIQRTVHELIDQVSDTSTKVPNFLVSGAPWKRISWQQYQDLLKESEYAAWMAAFGFRVNHFTVFYNSLKTFRDLADLNEFVKKLGFPLNTAGGEIKGTPAVLLEQSSTLAYPVKVEFADRTETIPACYYEFARRYPMPNGKLFSGFLPDSADKIFESTDYRKR